MPATAPKSRFQESGNHVAAHKRMIETGAFELSADMAMLQLQQELMHDDKITPSEGYWKLKGAEQFLDIFKRLADKPKRAVSLSDANLNHRA